MSRLSKAIQHDRKALPTQWTLQKLANLSNDENSNSTPLAVAASTTISAMKPKQRPCKEFAQSLIQDIRIRLSKQHALCRDMIQPLKEKIKSSSNQNTILLQHSMKQMTDLEMLHADTHSLMHQISSASSTTIMNTNKNQLSDAAYDKLLLSTFEQIRSRHALTLESLADITSQSTQIDTILPNDQLDIFLRRRLSIQLLCDHYVWYAKYQKPTGAIYVRHNFLDLVQQAVTEAKHLCDANVGFAPEVNIHLDLDKNSEDEVCITLIRTWTYHALIELLKNAMSSTVQRYSLQQNKTNELVEVPSIDIHISKNSSKQKGIICSIVDQGIGLTPKSKPNQSYFEFATSKHWDRLQDQQSYATVRAPLRGLGVGLNQSQMMMQMFGGDVLLSSNEASTGFNLGCTAALVLPEDTSIVEYSVGNQF